MTRAKLRSVGAVALFAVLALCHGGGVGQDWSGTGGPRLSLSRDALDFGAVVSYEVVTSTVQIGNIGDEPLVIEGYKTSCPCVAMDLQERQLGPGDTTEAAVTLDLADYPSDVLRARVWVQSNDPEAPYIGIEVHADIQPEYTVEPQRLDFGKVKQGQSPSLSLLVRQTSAQTLKLERIETRPMLLASIRDLTPKETGGRAEGGEEPPKVYRVDVAIGPQARRGRLNTKLKLITNVSRIPEFRVPVTANIVGVECTISPKVVVFGPDAPGAAIGSLEVTGANDLEVLDVTSTIQDIALHAEAVFPHKVHRIRLSLKDAATPGEKTGKIHLTLQEGGLVEVTEVAVYGTVRQD